MKGEREGENFWKEIKLNSFLELKIVFRIENDRTNGIEVVIPLFYF